jgi:dTDP-glucose pyrophosphorylase
MAGRSQRFADAGFAGPKWQLPLAGRPMLHWALDSVVPLADAGAEVRLVPLAEHAAAAAALAATGPVPATVHPVDEVTAGQAATVASCLHEADLDRPLVVWCCDSRVEPAALVGLPVPSDALVVADLPGDHWSFAEVGDDGLVTRTTEKVRISRHASVGMYGFASAGTLLDAMASASARTPSGRGELFVAPLYNEVIASGAPVSVWTVAAADFLPMGTPDEYRQAASRLGG